MVLIAQMRKLTHSTHPSSVCGMSKLAVGLQSCPTVILVVHSPSIRFQCILTQLPDQPLPFSPSLPRGSDEEHVNCILLCYPKCSSFSLKMCFSTFPPSWKKTSFQKCSPPRVSFVPCLLLLGSPLEPS